MSINLPPLPEPPDDEYWELYSQAQMTAYALAAVEADRASRVPMTEEQMQKIGSEWAQSLIHGRTREYFGLIRLVEMHCGVGVKP